MRILARSVPARAQLCNLAFRLVLRLRFLLPAAVLRLRGLRQPQYRLRVGDIRVFYDVVDRTVEVLGIVSKSESDAWLAQFGSPE